MLHFSFFVVVGICSVKLFALETVISLLHAAASHRNIWYCDAAVRSSFRRCRLVALSRFVSRSTSADEEIATRVDRKSREENGAREWCKKAAGEREREREKERCGGRGCRTTREETNLHSAHAPSGATNYLLLQPLHNAVAVRLLLQRWWNDLVWHSSV